MQARMYTKIEYTKSEAVLLKFTFQILNCPFNALFTNLYFGK